MAYDEAVATRVRDLLRSQQGVTEKKMFGGLAFMLNGHMCCGVLREDLMLRLGEEGAAKALAAPHVREMDFTGKPMKTMVYVAAAGIRSEVELVAWIERAVAFAESLPPK